MSGTLVSLLIVESVMTAVVLGLFLYRGMLDMKEEDRLVLNDAESHLEREQAVIRRKVVAMSKYLTVTGIAWGALLVVIFGVWVAQGLNMI